MDLDKATILNAWKDEEYRTSLPPEVRERIPERPTGADGSELTDEQLEQAAGGFTPVMGAGVASAALSAGIAAEID